ncbi:hypothetical protein O3P69_015994 [Scylla paramamosain]|uniref:Tetratricopeptide repeat protein 1 n=1 Tax=Scylla paramamosain TaxID=85552 RepID=A0AAW0T9K7_SCYPA
MIVTTPSTPHPERTPTDPLRLAEQQEQEEEEEEGEESPCFTPEPDPPSAEKDKEEEEEDERKDAAKKKNEEEEEDEECFVDEEHLKDLELSMTEEERTARREESLQHKESGNTSFREGNLQQAVMSYTAGLRICPLAFPKDRAVLYANRAAARAKLDQKKQAIRDCSQAIELDESYTKAVLRRATLSQETDQLDDALRDFKRVLELQPSNQQAQEAVRRLPDMITERNEKLKEEMMGKLKDLGNMFLRPFGLSTSNFELKQDPNSGGYNINFKQNPDNSH